MAGMEPSDFLAEPALLAGPELKGELSWSPVQVGFPAWGIRDWLSSEEDQQV